MKPKLNLSNCTSWKHHRSGWGFCMNTLMPLHVESGISVIDYLEKFIKNENLIKKSWIGFVHNVSHHPDEIKKIYGDNNNWDLCRIVRTKTWAYNLKYCRGIFCLSDENKQFMKHHVPEHVPVDFVYHTTEEPYVKFDFQKFENNINKKIVLIGHWMRNFQSIFDLNSIYPKFILKCCTNAFDYSKINLLFNTNSSVDYIERLDNEKYDELLSENLVFLNLFDSSANNTVVECIARSTPLIINRLRSLENYLGFDYPLFYENLKDASLLINDNKKIFLAHEHLKNINKIKPNYFLNSIYNSKIYNSISLVKFL